MFDCNNAKTSSLFEIKKKIKLRSTKKEDALDVVKRGKPKTKECSSLFKEVFSSGDFFATSQTVFTTYVLPSLKMKLTQGFIWQFRQS